MQCNAMQCNACMDVCMYVCVCLSVCMSVCMYVCMIASLSEIGCTGVFTDHGDLWLLNKETFSFFVATASLRASLVAMGGGVAY